MSDPRAVAHSCVCDMQRRAFIMLSGERSSSVLELAARVDLARAGEDARVHAAGKHLAHREAARAGAAHERRRGHGRGQRLVRGGARAEPPVLARAPRVERAAAAHGRRVREAARHLRRQSEGGHTHRRWCPMQQIVASKVSIM